MNWLSEPIAIISFLLGSGGVTTMIAAWFGWRAKREEHAHPPAVPATIQQERLALQIERLTNAIERAVQLFELHKLIEGMRPK